MEKHAPKGHVWLGNRHRWKQVRLSKRTMFERMLFLAAMCQHVPGIEEAFQDGGRGSNRKEIVLARHHFPIVVYDFLGARRITTLVKEGQMDFLVERDGSTRLAAEDNRVRSLADLLTTKLLPDGALRNEFLAREQELVGSKGKLFLCAPVASREEILAVLQEMKRHQNDPADETPLEPTPLVSPDESSLLLLGLAAELPDATIEQSPVMVPSLEECVQKIQSKVRTLGLEQACRSPNFRVAIRLLRFFYTYHNAIPLEDDNHVSAGYLHPCRNEDANDKSCATYEIASTIASEGMYCSPCQMSISIKKEETHLENIYE
ncbi:hypothetical protein FisN_20Hu054 [Fistulifera solaris]|uniref:Uncharacterized protein n=1 Tax=Fistulifera solaris TaxID=1519565 RepID=A0A1Z5KC31_FISSO|nr:hypothetical protein FisN_20Hu054 [Fistulifera solaris]|eukprot:GAX23850.1 hypothetical protein FisN_20Hu054 [Fistulifera solaris]